MYLSEVHRIVTYLHFHTLNTSFIWVSNNNLLVQPQVWIRRNDYHILTRGKTNYITDRRFQVLHQADSSEWTLQIRPVQADDDGTYECQVGPEGGGG